MAALNVVYVMEHNHLPDLAARSLGHYATRPSSLPNRPRISEMNSSPSFIIPIIPLFTYSFLSRGPVLTEMHSPITTPSVVQVATELE